MGVFRVMSSAAARRTREMGVRIALGANAGSVVHLRFARVVMRLVLGLLPGLAGGAALGGPLSCALYGVDPRRADRLRAHRRG